MWSYIGTGIKAFGRFTGLPLVCGVLGMREVEAGFAFTPRLDCFGWVDLGCRIVSGLTIISFSGSPSFFKLIIIYVFFSRNHYIYLLCTNTKII